MSAPLEIEIHPFPALLPPQATVMMMGTFPPKEDKRAMQFHYPNFQNDMWRVYELVFFNDTATTEIYTLSLHDALPISLRFQAGQTS